jgi:formate dehydrogenase subunit gamma
MTTGEVDVNWAKQHHNLWYEELQRKGAEGDGAQKDPTTVVNEQPA